MREKTLSDTVYEGRWLHISHVAEAVKKLKEVLGGLLTPKLEREINKIFGRFNSPQETKINSGDSGFESQPEGNHAQDVCANPECGHKQGCHRFNGCSIKVKGRLCSCKKFKPILQQKKKGCGKPFRSGRLCGGKCNGKIMLCSKCEKKGCGKGYYATSPLGTRRRYSCEEGQLCPECEDEVGK